MSEATTTPGLLLEATLPLEWIDAPTMTQASSELQHQGNVALLRALSAIETSLPEHEVHAEATQKALERVEAKLDIVFLLLSRLASTSVTFPPEKPVTLSSNTITWTESGSAPVVGQSLQVTLYLNPRLPQPLHLPVTINDLRTKDSGVEVVGTLQSVGDELEEWLTRTIFRYHRRALQARKQSL